MLFMVCMTAWAMTYSIFYDFPQKGLWHLVVIGSIIFGLEVWMLIEACMLWLKLRKEPAESRLEATAGD